MDDTEFEHIATRLRPKLKATAERIAQTSRMAEADVEDAVQETLIRLWRTGNRLDGYRSIESLAVTIVRNVCIDMSRHNPPAAAPIDGLQIAAGSSADSSLTAESTRGMMDRLMARLPATQQRLLKMRGEGMSLDDIAAVMQMPKTSVKTLIARARRELLKNITLKKKSLWQT